MEHIYTSYCKKIEDINFYFVKKFQVYNDLVDIPPILEGYGMHTDFDKACRIAGVSEKSLKARLLQEILGSQTSAKVIEMKAGEVVKKRKRIKFL